MNKIVLTLLLVFSLSTNVFSQKELSDYTYVVVPDSYSFLSENDQYQLNSLTKFLFNKYGFHAYFNNELPNIGRCEGLWVDVEKDAGFIWTKMVIVLKDCKGSVVHRSFEGRSKRKEYKKSNQEALRNAFESIAALEVQQGEMVVFGEASKTNNESTIDTAQVISEKTTTKTLSTAKEATLSAPTLEEKERNLSQYTNNGATFLLNPSNGGYALYEKVDELTLKLKGDLFVKDGKNLQFRDTDGNIFNARFDAQQNLIIETSFQQMIFEVIR